MVVRRQHQHLRPFCRLLLRVTCHATCRRRIIHHPHLFLLLHLETRRCRFRTVRLMMRLYVVGLGVVAMRLHTSVSHMLIATARPQAFAIKDVFCLKVLQVMMIRMTIRLLGRHQRHHRRSNLCHHPRVYGWEKTILPRRRWK